MSFNAEDVRARWGEINGQEPPMLRDIPLEPFEPLTAFDGHVLDEAASRALKRPDSQGKLRPTPWREEAERLARLLAQGGRCQHDLLPGVCSECVPERRGPLTRTRVDGTPSKADSVGRLCHLLGVPNMGIGVGSSIDSDLFRVMAQKTGVPTGSMPEIGEAVATKAGVTWDRSCDSRGTASPGGSTVTGVGLDRLVTALQRLL